MSERSSVTIAEILGENYKITNIECSDYNPSIDGNITVTITVTDVYGDAISNESVTVTASEGNFTQLNGSSITAAATVTATTNLSGQFTLTYTCSEWGLITFVANNTSTQINVQGWRTITSTSNLELRANGTFAEVRLHTDTAISVTTDFRSITNWIPSDYAPKMPQYELGDYGGYMVRIDNTTIMYRSLSGSMTIKLYATFLYRY